MDCDLQRYVPYVLNFLQDKISSGICPWHSAVGGEGGGGGGGSKCSIVKNLRWREVAVYTNKTFCDQYWISVADLDQAF